MIYIRPYLGMDLVVQTSIFLSLLLFHLLGIVLLLVDLSDIPRHAFQVAVFSSHSDMLQLRLEAIPKHLANLLLHEKVFPVFIIAPYFHSRISLSLLIFLTS